MSEAEKNPAVAPVETSGYIAPPAAAPAPAAAQSESYPQMAAMKSELESLRQQIASKESELSTRDAEITALQAPITDRINVALAKARLFGNTFDAIDLLKWARKYGPLLTQILALSKEWDSIGQPISDKMGMKSRLIVAIKFMRITASITTTTVDDKIVDELDAILNGKGVFDDIVDLIQQIWPTPGQFDDDGSPVALRAPAAVFAPERIDAMRARFLDKKIDWNRLLELLPEVIRIVGLFT